MPEILKTAKNKPSSLMESLTMANSAINDFFNGLLDKPINRARAGLKQLQAPAVDIPTGPVEITGADKGGLYPAQSRNVLVNGQPAPGASNIPEAIRARMAQSKVGSMANTVPQSILGEPNPLVEQVGTQAATLPESLLAGKTERGTQFLTAADGGPNPGSMTEPAVLRTRDPQVMRERLALLEQVERDPVKMAAFSPAERANISSLASQLRAQLQNPGKMPTTVGELTTKLDPLVTELNQQAAQMREIGHNAVADTLEAKAAELANTGEINLKNLNRMRQTENANSSSYFSKDNLGQFIDADKSRAQSIISRTMDKFAREALYRELEKAHPELAKGSIAKMKQRQGALMNIQNNFEDVIKATRTDAAKSLGTDWDLRLQKNVKPVATRSGVHPHIGGIGELIRPRSVRELKGINNSGEMFQPRTSPFAPVSAMAIEDALKARRKRK